MELGCFYRMMLTQVLNSSARTSIPLESWAGVSDLKGATLFEGSRFAFRRVGLAEFRRVGRREPSQYVARILALGIDKTLALATNWFRNLFIHDTTQMLGFISVTCCSSVGAKGGCEKSTRVCLLNAKSAPLGVLNSGEKDLAKRELSRDHSDESSGFGSVFTAPGGSKSGKSGYSLDSKR